MQTTCMSFLSRLLRAGDSSAPDHGSESDADEMIVCSECGDTVDEYESEDGECYECRYPDGYPGPKYCCGAIYEEGEDTCLSCGEPL